MSQDARWAEAVEEHFRGLPVEVPRPTEAPAPQIEQPVPIPPAREIASYLERFEHAPYFACSGCLNPFNGEDCKRVHRRERIREAMITVLIIIIAIVTALIVCPRGTMPARAVQPPISWPVMMLLTGGVSQ